MNRETKTKVPGARRSGLDRAHRPRDRPRRLHPVQWFSRSAAMEIEGAYRSLNATVMQTMSREFQRYAPLLGDLRGLARRAATDRRALERFLEREFDLYGPSGSVPRLLASVGDRLAGATRDRSSSGPIGRVGVAAPRALLPSPARDLPPNCDRRQGSPAADRCDRLRGARRHAAVPPRAGGGIAHRDRRARRRGLLRDLHQARRRRGPARFLHRVAASRGRDASPTRPGPDELRRSAPSIPSMPCSAGSGRTRASSRSSSPRPWTPAHARAGPRRRRPGRRAGLGGDSAQYRSILPRPVGPDPTGPPSASAPASRAS